MTKQEYITEWNVDQAKFDSYIREIMRFDIPGIKCNTTHLATGNRCPEPVTRRLGSDEDHIWLCNKCYKNLGDQLKKAKQLYY
jgi:hypothetical protein